MRPLSVDALSSVWDSVRGRAPLDGVYDETWRRQMVEEGVLPRRGHRLAAWERWRGPWRLMTVGGFGRVRISRRWMRQYDRYPGDALGQTVWGPFVDEDAA